MFLKSLVLRGFKTFADKTDLEFEDTSGITAIVGPNGCGKSNVVDAFRFVLGEGNFRELRVNTLPEVIFAGTTARKPLSLAEVILTFDNSNRRLPIEYAEVMVRRRTFRDGQSEFSINNQACRLKDIRDLFLDTGLSTESMSIIGQGRVDAVLSSQPEERRVIFEEVAGILKYKNRKLEVERKLILTEQNLLRITDLKVEIGEQVINLESQAKKAREYQELSGRLQVLEKAIFKKQLQSLLEKRTEVEVRIVSLKAKESESEEKRRKMQEEKISLFNTLKEAEREVEEAQRALEELNEKIESERSGALIERERALFEERNKLRDLAEEERFLGFEIKKIADELSSLKAKRDGLEKKIGEWSGGSAEECGELKETIQLINQLLKQLNSLSQLLYAKNSLVLPSQAEDHILGVLQEEIQRLAAEERSLAESEKLKVEGLEKIGGKLEELKAELGQKEEAPAEVEAESLKPLLAQKAELQDKLQQLKSKREAGQKRLEELEQAPQEEKGDTEQLFREQVVEARLQSDLDQIKERVESEYNLTVEELLALELEEVSILKGKKEVEELRGRLRALEPVNLLAIEEFDRVKERYNFIEEQHNDLNSARENLKTLITELDLKAREDFISTIAKVSANFSETFGVLFEGGEAKIELEEGKDPLLAGIEIMVCPSKRKWLNLSLMSGGERALTAIAILFACLKTQPTPLCLLDEVDAPLDDANVVRFASFLSQYKKHTQIIVITHNKRTMEVADTIYGITMEEPGISKLISMKMEKV